MAASIVVDAGFVVALLSKNDGHHRWAASQAEHLPQPWHTCEAALSESFHLLGPGGCVPLLALLRRAATVVSFELNAHIEPVARLMQRYAEIPMSFADACLVRMSEVLPDPIVVTTDSDFHVYRRHGRQTIRCLIPQA